MNGYSFTERARRILARSREEAARLHHEYVGTEHILLALVGNDEVRQGVATAVLDNLGIDRAAVRQMVDETVKRGAAGHTAADLPYTSRAKKVLELAMTEARALSHTHVGSEHLLLGLLAEERGIGAQILREHGLALDAARAETLRLLGTERASDAGKVVALPTAGRGSAPLSPADRAREELAWTRLTGALDVCTRVGVAPVLTLEADGTLTVSLGPDLVVTVDFPPGVGLRTRAPPPDADPR